MRIWITETENRATGEREVLAFSDREEVRRHLERSRDRKLTKLLEGEASGSLYFLLAHTPSGSAIPPSSVVTSLRRESVAQVVNEVVRALARLTGFTQADIRDSRYWSAARVRKLGYWVTAGRCQRAWSDLGRAWGKDHSTVIHGCRGFQADLVRRTPWAVELSVAWDLAAGRPEAAEAVVS